MRDADLLRPLLLEERAARLETVLAARLRGVTVVLERLEDEGNVSAVLRTAEAMGVQDVHVIEPPDRPLRIAPDITQGCHRWLDVHRTSDADACLDTLRARGFRLYGSAAGRSAVPVERLDFAAPAALVFGNEKTGVAPGTLARCDATFWIEMYGMTRSYNVSVAAALALREATAARRRAVGAMTDLSPEELAELRDRWYRAEVREADKVLRRLRGEGPR